MKIRSFALAASLAAVLAVPSFATIASAHEGGEKKFPIAAAEFKAHVDARLAKARARMDAHIAKDKIPADKANEIRARFDAGVVKVQAEVAKATADGVVTKDEAKAVREASRAMHPEHHHGGAPAKK
jgi:hypothetical protein